MQSEILYPEGGHQFGLTGQQDLYDYFAGRGKKKSQPKKGIARIIRKVSKPLKENVRNPIIKSKPSSPQQARETVRPAGTPARPASKPATGQQIRSTVIPASTSAKPEPLKKPAVPVSASTITDRPIIKEPEVNEIEESTSQNDQSEEAEGTFTDEFEESDDSSEELDEYDHFMGLGKKGEQKKKENRNIRASRQASRIERRTMKNDERRAGVERTRAETQLMKGMSNSPSPSGNTSDNNSASTGNDAYKAGSDNTGNVPEEKQSNTTLIIVAAVAGVVIVGAGLWMMNARKQQAYPQAA